MQRLLTARERQFYDLAATLADDFATRAEQHDREASFPFENFERMRDAGYLRITVPEELGGLGATLPELTVAQERLAMGDPATALIVNMHVSPVGQLASLWRTSPTPKLEQWLRDVAEGRVISMSISAEPGAPLLRHSTCVATKTNGGYRVTGKKIFGTGSSVMTHFTTMAQYDDPEHGPTVLFFRIPKDSEGLVIHDTWDVLGLRATQSNDLTFMDVFVPADNVFHRFPAHTLDGKMLQTVWGWAMPTFGATYLGMAAGAMQHARQYVLRLGKQDDPQVQQVFAEMEVHLETARAVIHRVAEEMASGQILRELTVQSGMSRVVLAKLVAANSAIAITDLAFRVCGGWAYFNRSPLARLYRDVRAATIQPYNNFEAAKIIGHTSLGVHILLENPIPDVTPAVALAAGD